MPLQIKQTNRHLTSNLSLEENVNIFCANSNVFSSLLHEFETNKLVSNAFSIRYTRRDDVEIGFEYVIQAQFVDVFVLLFSR